MYEAQSICNEIRVASDNVCANIAALRLCIEKCLDQYHIKSVESQGRWVRCHEGIGWDCPECGSHSDSPTKYCSNCGEQLM